MRGDSGSHLTVCRGMGLQSITGPQNAKTILSRHSVYQTSQGLLCLLRLRTLHRSRIRRLNFRTSPTSIMIGIQPIRGVIGPALARELVAAYLKATFSGEARHQRD